MLAFIVGNGKSLNETNVNLLIGRTSYACNRINLIYAKTEWRPTVYLHPESVAPDLPYIRQNVDLGITCWIGEHFKEIQDTPNVHWIKECHHHLLNFDSPNLPDEWHFPQMCSFGGSVNMAMQRAVMDGFDDLVLVGCDLEYKDKKQSHFHPGYEHGGEQPAFYASRNALYGHVHALNWIRRKRPDVRVRNATVGGLLEIWPRVDLKDV